ncbi:hypothetical protein PG984_010150 [Apiospora sp. TS-2023a]
MATISPIHPYKFPRLGILELLQSRRGSPFERLPTEIIVDILLRLDELVSLDCLLHASPVVYRIFDEFAVRVTEAILYNGYGPILKGLHTKEPDSKPGVACSFVPVQMYLVAMIRSATLPVGSLLEFVKRVIIPYQLDAVTRINLTTLESPNMITPRALPADTPPAVVRSLVATSRHLTALSVDCLRFYLDRFRAVRPSHPKTTVARDFHRLPLGMLQDFEMEPWKGKPKGREVPVQDHGPPTWLEEQRVLRAFWCLQIIVDLRKAAKASRLDGWPHEDVVYLRGWHATTVWTVEKLLRRYLDRRTADDSLANSDQYREILAVVWYLEAVHECRWPEPEPQQQHQPQPRLEVRREGAAPRRRRQDLERLGDASEAAKRYVALQYLSYTSLGRYAPYNALGFAVWCDERMRAAQLLPSPSPPPMMYHSSDGERQRRLVVYAWLSLLPAPDWRRLVEFRRNQRQLVCELGYLPDSANRWSRPGFARTEEERRRLVQRNWLSYLSIDIS